MPTQAVSRGPGTIQGPRDPRRCPSPDSPLSEPKCVSQWPEATPMTCSRLCSVRKTVVHSDDASSCGGCHAQVTGCVLLRQDSLLPHPSSRAHSLAACRLAPIPRGSKARERNYGRWGHGHAPCCLKSNSPVSPPCCKNPGQASNASVSQNLSPPCRPCSSPARTHGAAQRALAPRSGAWPALPACMSWHCMLLAAHTDGPLLA